MSNCEGRCVLAVRTEQWNAECRQLCGVWYGTSRRMLCSQIVRRRQWHPTPALLPGKSHGQRSLVGCSPWGGKELGTTKRLHFHFSLSCTGEGKGNPLQRSCLESLRDGGAWWAAVYGVAQSQTRLKWLSSRNLFYRWEHRHWSQLSNPRWCEYDPEKTFPPQGAPAGWQMETPEPTD